MRFAFKKEIERNRREKTPSERRDAWEVGDKKEKRAYDVVRDILLVLMVGGVLCLCVCVSQQKKQKRTKHAITDDSTLPV